MGKYDNEVLEKWGNTNAYDEYKQKMNGISKQDLKEITSEGDRILKNIADMMDFGIDSAHVYELLLEYQDYITDNFYTCTDEIMQGLADMYVEDDRFKTNLDKIKKGFADFLSKAIKHFMK